MSELTTCPREVARLRVEVSPRHPSDPARALCGRLTPQCMCEEVCAPEYRRALDLACDLEFACECSSCSTDSSWFVYVIAHRDVPLIKVGIARAMGGTRLRTWEGRGWRLMDVQLHAQRQNAAREEACRLRRLSELGRHIEAHEMPHDPDGHTETYRVTDAVWDAAFPGWSA